MSQQTSRLQPDRVPSGRNKSSLLKIKGCKKYPVKLKSDKKTCDIISACVLEDSTLILADNSNMKLKCLDKSTFTVTGSCDLPGYPLQVCAVSQQAVAVACGSTYVIQFVSVVGCKLEQTWGFSTGFHCYGVAYTDGKLYVADQTSVYVYTMSGDRLNQFKHDQTGEDIFSYICSLVISREKSWIYVADLGNGLII
jgi:outer membrane protein assembly factor BamB